MGDSSRDIAEQLGYANGLAWQHKNPYIPADEWNHDGVLHSAYERGYANGIANGMARASDTAPPPDTFTPTVGTPVWCQVDLGQNNIYEGWGIVTSVELPTTWVTIPNGNGGALHSSAIRVWERKPPLPQWEEKLLDDDGDEFVVGYGDYMDLDDDKKFNKLFYITTEKEEITIALADVTPLLEAIKKVSRQ